MKVSLKKNVKSLLTLVLALTLVVLAATVSAPVTNVKADDNAIFELNSASDLGLSGIDKKAEVPAGKYGTNDYFELVGGNFRANSDTLAVEIAKKSASSIQFTVTGIANLEISVSSTSGSNSSDVALIGPDGSLIRAVGESADYTVVDGSKAVTLKYNNLKAGTYKLLSPADYANSSRGFRVYSMKVTQNASGAFAERPAWNTIATPVVSNIKQDGAYFIAEVTALVGFNGGDKLTVEMFDESGKSIAVENSLVDATVSEIKFTPASSGNYYFVATLERDGEQALVSAASAKTHFLYPLAKAEISSVTNAGSGSAVVSWDEVKEAAKYEVFYKKSSDSDYKSAGTTSATSLAVSGLTCDVQYDFYVVAIRDTEKAEGTVLSKMIRDRIDRNWVFTYFGSSTGAAKNYMTDLDEDAFTFKLVSCTYKEDGTIDQKGGKFTAYFDGITYYYTQIDAKNENFELTATFTVDYINPVPDGQEGFGLVIRDSIGEYGVNNQNFETNSVSLIATKFEATSDGTKYSMKDGLGMRFAYGLTPENIADGTMSTVASKKSYPCQYEQGNLINAGDSYTLTVKKTNTGYHCIYTNAEGVTKEEILYGVDKLLQIDKDYVYVGFAVARGCNATVSNVSFTVTDAKNDPPAEPEPEPSFNVNISLVSPESSGTTDYLARFRINCDGTAYISDAFGNAISETVEVKNGVITEVKVPAEVGSNSYVINFKAADGYRNAAGEIPKSSIVSLNLRLAVKIYNQPVLYVTPDALATGTGTKEDPISLRAALAYVVPGQKIELADGVYSVDYLLKITKGNSGTAENYKYMVAAEGAHPVLDFSKSKDGGFVNWGDYWYFEGFDVCNTPDNYKGIQLAGSNCIMNRINAYNNGDTGLQISGSSNDPKNEWPKNNLVINCTSHDNADSAKNNGDGFAAKLSVGEGNKFFGCIAYNNIDDGWDLYAKVETGAIGAVTIENCIAYNNGFLSDGSGYGDGNGFKLGGEGIAVAHVIKNSISFNNYTAGITSNSNPAVQVYNCTSYGNGNAGLTLYGKGDTERNFVVEGMLSMKNGADDNMEQTLDSEINYFQIAGTTLNSAAATLKSDVFKSVDTTAVPTRDAKGEIVIGDLFVIADESISAKSGAVLAASNYTAPESTATFDPTPTPVPTEAPVITEAPTDAPADVTPVPTKAPESGDDEKSGNSTIWFVLAGILAAALIGGCVALIIVLGKKKA